jgi:hypothetical protein
MNRRNGVSGKKAFLRRGLPAAVLPAFVLLTSVLLTGGCTSFIPGVVEQAGRVLDGSAFAKKTLSRYQGLKTGGAPADMEVREVVNKQGNVSLVILLKEFPAVRFQGSDPLGAGDFYFTSLEYLGGNAAGWNEFTLELSGAGSFVKSEGAAALSLSGLPEAVQIVSGKIRRNETRITGDEALTSLRNRHERILALAEWMRSREGPAFADQKSFEAHWRPLLLPETVSAKKRPPEWKKEGARWVWAEDLRWNTTYTEDLFPEVFWPFRNSGALLRDWEEALDWIYFEYSREKIENWFSGEISLKHIK